MSGKQEGFVDKGLNNWQNLNKVTLAVESGMMVAGLGLGVPWLLAIGATGAAVDAVQIYGIDKVKDWRKKRNARTFQRRSTGWAELPSDV